MVRKTKAEAQATREAILEAAARVFYAKGVSRAGLEEIAKEAGVTRGAVYWHFKNKADIFAALHDQLYVSFSGMVLQDLEIDHPQPLQQLEELCVELLLDLEKNEQKRLVLSIFFLKCDYSGEMECFLEYQLEQRKEKFGLFSHYFQRAIDKGFLPKDANPCAMTYALTCFITGVAYDYLRYPSMIDFSETVPLLVAQFMAGIKASPSTALLSCQKE